MRKNVEMNKNVFSWIFLSICSNLCYSAAVLRNIRKIFVGFGGILTLNFNIVFLETS